MNETDTTAGSSPGAARPRFRRAWFIVAAVVVIVVAVGGYLAWTAASASAARARFAHSDSEVAKGLAPAVASAEARVASLRASQAKGIAAVANSTQPAVNADLDKAEDSIDRAWDAVYAARQSPARIAYINAYDIYRSRIRQFRSQVLVISTLARLADSVEKASADASSAASSLDKAVGAVGRKDWKAAARLARAAERDYGHAADGLDATAKINPGRGLPDAAATLAPERALAARIVELSAAADKASASRAMARYRAALSARAKATRPPVMRDPLMMLTPAWPNVDSALSELRRAERELEAGRALVASGRY